MSKKESFIIPTEEEVIEFIKEYVKDKKINWPTPFCIYYGERFWNSYNSSGWRLSAGKGGPVKNWQSCFKNNWKTLKYQEDLNMLRNLMPKQRLIDHDTLEYLDEVLGEFRTDKDSVTKERLASCYDWLKEFKLLRLNEEEKQRAIVSSIQNLIDGKALAVIYTFNFMVGNLITFNYYFNEITK